MIKNNIYTFLFHILSTVIFFLTYLLFEQIFKTSLDYTFMFGYLISCLVFGNFLEVQDNAFKNLLSVLSIFAIGIITCFLTVFLMGQKYLFIYVIYFSLPGSLFEQFFGEPKLYGEYISIFLILLIPTVLIWLGLEWKAYRIRKAAKKDLILKAE